MQYQVFVQNHRLHLHGFRRWLVQSNRKWDKRERGDRLPPVANNSKVGWAAATIWVSGYLNMEGIHATYLET
jgi:hypothetical protein